MRSRRNSITHCCGRLAEAHAFVAMHFNGQRFTDSRALGQALHEADRARAKSFWQRRFHDLHQWITDTLGDYRLGRKLAKVRDRNLSRGQQVDLCILLLWPEAPIELHGVPLQKDALDKTAQLAWRGDETAAARLLKVASDSRVWHAYALDAGGEEIARIYEASWGAKEDYAKWRERLRSARDSASAPRQSHQPPPPSARGDERRTLAQVTRRRRRRRGWPWPEARFRPLMARQVMEPRTERSLWSLPTDAIRHRRACERSESSGAARRRTRPPGQPPATLLAAFEPSLHFVDLAHALDDDAAGPREGLRPRGRRGAR